MAIQTPAQLLAALTSAQLLSIDKVTSAPAAGSLHSLWTDTGATPAGSTPPSCVGGNSGEIPNALTPGAAAFLPASSGAQSYLAALAVTCIGHSGQILLIDRQWHGSGINAAITGAQFVTTQPLKRSTGLDCELFLEMHGTIGATAATVVVEYTDGMGTPRSASLTIPASATQLRRVFRVPTVFGVSSVQSVNFTNSTGAGGNVGLLIARRLTVARFLAGQSIDRDAYACGLALVPDDACISAIVRVVTAAAHTIAIDATIAQG